MIGQALSAHLGFYLVVLQRRRGGKWRREELADEPAGAGAGGPLAFTSHPDAQQKSASPDKRLFSGAPSNTFSVEAHSAL